MVTLSNYKIGGRTGGKDSKYSYDTLTSSLLSSDFQNKPHWETRETH